MVAGDIEGEAMTRKATIAALRADLAAANRDMWQLAEEVHIQKAETVRLQAIVDRQDETILALWAMVELAALKWKLKFCIEHDVTYVKNDPLQTVEEFLEDRWAAREEET